jgi:hypothetical protein
VHISRCCVVLSKQLLWPLAPEVAGMVETRLERRFRRLTQAAPSASARPCQVCRDKRRASAHVRDGNFLGEIFNYGCSRAFLP